MTDKECSVGTMVNNWKIVSEIFRNKWKKKTVTCECSCGNKKDIEITHLKNNTKCRSCYLKSKERKEYTLKEYKAKWYQDNKERVEKYKKNNPTSKENKFKYSLKYNHKLSVEDYNKLSESQNHKCSICGKNSEYNRNGALYVDHNHATKQIRGLLCQQCNSALGLFQDSPEILINALDYLINNDKIYEKTSINPIN
jgi:hypothetical protein